VVLQINYGVIKLQKYQIFIFGDVFSRRISNFGDIIKLRRLKYVIKMTSQKFSIFKPPPLAKSWLRPCYQQYVLDLFHLFPRNGSCGNLRNHRHETLLRHFKGYFQTNQANLHANPVLILRIPFFGHSLQA